LITTVPAKHGTSKNVTFQKVKFKICSKMIIKPEFAILAVKICTRKKQSEVA